MKKCLLVELKRILYSPLFIVSVLLICMCGAITFARNYTIQNLKYLYNIGTLNLFIYSNIVSNAFTALIAPIVAGLIGSFTIVEDMDTNYHRQLILRTCESSYFNAKSLAALISGASIFLCAYFLMFVAMFILDPSASVKTIINRTGPLGELYDRSMFLYSLAYVGYTMLFGATYSYLSFSIGLCFKNRYLAIGLPFSLYYGSAYIYGLETRTGYEILSYFLPNISFNIYNGQSTLQLVTQLGTLLAIGFFLSTIKRRTIYENGI